MGVCVCEHILLLPLYGLGRSYRGLYYPTQPPLFLGNIHSITRTNIILKTWIILTFSSIVVQYYITVPLSMQISQPIKRTGGAY